MEEESNEKSTSSASSKTASENVLDEYTEKYEHVSENWKICNKIRNDDTFDRNVEALVDFHSTFGHWKVPGNKDIEKKYKGLHNWLMRIRSIYRSAYFDGQCSSTYILPRHRYEKLVAIGFPFEEIEYNEEDTEGCKRRINRVIDLCTKRYDKLSEREQKKCDDLFDTKLKYLVEFHRKFGHWKVSQDENKFIYNWLYGINRTYKNAFYEGQYRGSLHLPRHRYEKLVAIGYPFEEMLQDTTPPNKSTTTTRDSIQPLVSPSSSVPSTSSNTRIDEEGKVTSSSTEECERNMERVLNEYTERYEKLPKERQNGVLRETTPSINSNTTTRDPIPDLVPTSSRSSTTNSNMKFEKIVTDEYERNLEKVLDEYTKCYEQLPEKCQKRWDEQFEEMLQSLLGFYRQFRHWKVPQDDSTLYQWVSRVRQIYRRACIDGKLIDGYAFPRHRHEKLVAIGYPFNEIIQIIPSQIIPREESASIRRSKRNIENKKKEAVAVSTRTRKEEEEDTSTDQGSVNHSRNLDHVISRNIERYEKLSKQHRELSDEKFDAHFQSLVEFYNECGHYEVPKTRKGCRQLHNWVQSIHRFHRRAYFHGKDEGGVKLTRDRYSRLTAIGFPFKKIESEEKDSADSTIQLTKHSSSTSTTKKYSSSPKGTGASTIKTIRKSRQTSMSREKEVQSFQSKILQLETENESHYETIYRLKDEKESLVEKVEEQSEQIDMMKQKLDVYRKRVQSLEQDSMESISLSSKRQCTSFQSSNAEIERLQEERQLLIDQLTASTENYRKLLDLIPRSETK